MKPLNFKPIGTSWLCATRTQRIKLASLTSGERPTRSRVDASPHRHSQIPAVLFNLPSSSSSPPVLFTCSPAADVSGGVNARGGHGGAAAGPRRRRAEARRGGAAPRAGVRRGAAHVRARREGLVAAGRGGALAPAAAAGLGVPQPPPVRPPLAGHARRRHARRVPAFLRGLVAPQHGERAAAVLSRTGLLATCPFLPCFFVGALAAGDSGYFSRDYWLLLRWVSSWVLLD
jgi:hypothetical protein